MVKKGKNKGTMSQVADTRLITAGIARIAIMSSRKERLIGSQK